VIIFRPDSVRCPAGRVEGAALAGPIQPLLPDLEHKEDEERLKLGALILALAATARVAPVFSRPFARALFGVELGAAGEITGLNPLAVTYLAPQPFGIVNPAIYGLKPNYYIPRGTAKDLPSFLPGVKEQRALETHPVAEPASPLDPKTAARKLTPAEYGIILDQLGNGTFKEIFALKDKLDSATPIPGITNRFEAQLFVDDYLQAARLRALDQAAYEARVKAAEKAITDAAAGPAILPSITGLPQLPGLAPHTGPIERALGPDLAEQRGRTQPRLPSGFVGIGPSIPFPSGSVPTTPGPGGSSTTPPAPPGGGTGTGPRRPRFTPQGGVIDGLITLLQHDP
jgi:hypothetical protein